VGGGCPDTRLGIGSCPSIPSSKILNFRRANRGFEGLDLTPDESTLFIAMRSPLDDPTSGLSRVSRNVRILQSVRFSRNRPDARWSLAG